VGIGQDEPLLAEILSVLRDGDAPFAELYRFIVEPLEPRPTVSEAFSALRDALHAGWIVVFLNMSGGDRSVSVDELRDLERKYADWLSVDEPLPDRGATGFDRLRLFLELTPAGREVAEEVDARRE